MVSFEDDLIENLLRDLKIDIRNFDKFDLFYTKMHIIDEFKNWEKKMEDKIEEEMYCDIEDEKDEAREKAYDDCKEEFSDAIKGYVDKMAKKAVENDSDEVTTSFWVTLQEKIDEILDYADRHVDPY